MSEEIDWSQPIRVPRGRSPFGVRQEQLRRAEALVAAAGGKMPKGDKQKAHRVEALASVVPALRYSQGLFLYRTLAPKVEIMADYTARPGPGRKVEWSDVALLALADWVDHIKAEAGKPLVDELALRRAQERTLRSAKDQAEAAGRPFDAEARKKAALPSVRTLREHLARGRRLQQGR